MQNGNCKKSETKAKGERDGSEEKGLLLNLNPKRERPMDAYPDVGAADAARGGGVEGADDLAVSIAHVAIWALTGDGKIQEKQLLDGSHWTVEAWVVGKEQKNETKKVVVLGADDL